MVLGQGEKTSSSVKEVLFLGSEVPFEAVEPHKGMEWVAISFRRPPI